MSLATVIPVILVTGIMLYLTYFFVSQSSVMQIENIKTMIENDRIDEALEKLMKMISKDKENGRLHYFLAMAFDKKGELSTAISEYQSCLRNVGFISETEQLNIHSRLADLYYKTKKFDDALGEYLLLTKKFPNDPYNLLQIGEIFFQRQKFGNAANYFKKSLKLESSNPKAHYNLGRIYYITKINTDSERHLKKAIELSPKYYDAHYYLGLLYIRLNMTRNAISHLTKGIYSLKFKGQSYYQIGRILINSKKYKESIKFITKAVPLLTNNKLKLEAKYLAAHAYENLDMIDEAIKYWNDIYIESSEFKDVSHKIALYSELSMDDKFKEYVIAKPKQFTTLIKHLLNQLDYKLLEESYYNSLVYAVGIPKHLNSQTTSKKENVFFVFVRDLDYEVDIKDIQLMKEKMNKKNCAEMMVFLPNEFTERVIEFSKTRQIHLYNKDRLIDLLQKIQY